MRVAEMLSCRYVAASRRNSGGSKRGHLRRECVASQTPATEQTRSFEVASIKKNNSGDTRWVYQMDPGGRFRVTRASLANLISIAYGTSSPLPGFQVLGGPNWIRTDRFDVVAKGDGNPTKDDFPLMLRSLLAERFNLRVHHEARERDVFALVTARSDRRLGPGLVERTSIVRSGAIRRLPRTARLRRCVLTRTIRVG